MEKTLQPSPPPPNVDRQRFVARLLASVWALVITCSLLIVGAFWGMDMPFAGPPPIVALVLIWGFAVASTIVAWKWERLGGILIIIAGVLPIALLPLALLIDLGASIVFVCPPALVLVPALAILAGIRSVTNSRQTKVLSAAPHQRWIWNLVAGAPLGGAILLGLVGLLGARGVLVKEAKMQADATATQATRTADATAQAPFAILMSANYSPNGKRIVTASLNGTARVWDAENGQQLLVLQHQGAVNVALFSPDGQRIVSADQSPGVYVWDAGTGNKLLMLNGSGVGYNAALSPDGKQIVTEYEYSMADSIRYGWSVWDATIGKMVVAFEANGVGRSTHVEFSPDGQKLITANYSGAFVLDVATGRQLLDLGRPHSNCAAFSPDGKQIVTGDWETARILDASTGKELLVLNGHSSSVEDISYSPDGKQVVSVSDTNVYVWDAEAGKQLVAWDTGSGVDSAEFSPDGKRILTAHQDGAARVWDASTGRQVLVLRQVAAGQ
jgi:Tol biopolymer transport system component